MKLGVIGLFVAALLIRFTVCATVEGYLELPGEYTNLDLEHTSIELLEITNDLNKSPIKRHGYINNKGIFKFTDIPKGSYLLSLSHIEFNLVPFKSRVDINEQDEVVIHLVQGAQLWEELGPEIPHPLRVIPNTKFPERQYIKNRNPSILESGPIATVINNPLYLAGVFLVILAVAGPYLLEKFDPETAKLMKEQKAQRQGQSSAAALKAAEALNFDVGSAIGNSRASNADKDSSK